MRQQHILAERWYVKQLDSDERDIAALTREAASPGDPWLATDMPAQVHDVLLEHGLISDPHVGKNAAESAWVGERDWAYACAFPSPPEPAGAAFLRFGGLDTIASAYLNGTHIGTFDNMFRQYAVDVTERLSPPAEDNVLLILFSSPLRVADEMEQRVEPLKGVGKHKYLRKSSNDFSSYLGARPHSVKVGIHRDVVLDVADGAWIEDAWVRSELASDLSRAVVRVSVGIAGAGACIEWRLTDPSGDEVVRGAIEAPAGTSEIEIAVSGPKLWWPHTHGSPHLYRLQVDLSSDGTPVDTRRVDFGIRDVRPVLVNRETGEKRFRFQINGQPIFLRGACWAPVEGMTHCWHHERAVRLLELAEHAGMNAIRVWGGGHVPPEEFYEECDRRGILVWQDFMFGYGMYPSGDPAFADNCRAEVEDVVRRLRNHPCILLWVGGNENHMGWDFQFGGQPEVGCELFDEIMPQACERLDPTRIFHASSPFGGRAPNWPLEGDWHDYTTLTFSPEASVPLFGSEVGRVSAMPIASMRRFLTEEELWPAGHDPAIRKSGQPAWPPMWQYRSVDGSWDKVGHLEEFCDPACAEDLIRILGTAHGEYLQRRVERHRRGVPDGAPDGKRRCRGNLVWRLNDSWPIIYWSVVDYYLQPKIAYYYLRRAYAPVLVSFERTADRIAVWVVNDSPEPVGGPLIVKRLRFDGTCRGELAAEVSVAPGEATRCLDVVDFGPISLRHEFLLADFAGRQATCLLIGERYLHLPAARLSARRVEGGLEVATDSFARQVVLEAEGVMGAVFEDNFFDLPPGQMRRIGIVDAAGGASVIVSAYNAEPVRIPLWARDSA